MSKPTSNEMHHLPDLRKTVRKVPRRNPVVVLSNSLVSIKFIQNNEEVEADG